MVPEQVHENLQRRQLVEELVQSRVFESLEGKVRFVQVIEGAHHHRAESEICESQLLLLLVVPFHHVHHEFDVLRFLLHDVQHRLEVLAENHTLGFFQEALHPEPKRILQTRELFFVIGSCVFIASQAQVCSCEKEPAS